MYYGRVIRPARLNSVIVVIVCVVFVMPAKLMKMTKKQELVLKKSRKRRGGTRNFDDDLTLCNHGIDALVQFMDQTFFQLNTNKLYDRKNINCH